MFTSNVDITYYDFCDLQYSSYFLVGLIKNQEQLGFRFNIAKRLSSDLPTVPFDERWRNFLRRIPVFHVKAQNDQFLFCIDPRDPYDPDTYGTAYHPPLLDTVRHYFKVNYHAESVRQSGATKTHLQKIQPAPAFLPLRPPRIFQHYPPLFGQSRGLWTWSRRLQRVKDSMRLLSLDYLRSLRGTRQDIDVFFVVMYRDEPIHREYNEFRYEIVRKLRERRDLRIITGLVARGRLPAKCVPLQVPGYGFKDYITHLARARVNIYVRGLFDCLSFKFGQLLALGKPVAGQTIHNQRETLCQPSHMKAQFAHEEPGAIVEAAFNLLDAPEEQKFLSAANANYFDGQLDPQISLNRLLAHVLSDSPDADVSFTTASRTNSS